jgi:hypothetical protein
VEITLESDPETECPCRIVIVLELSLDTNERGRGIICTSSENPTRARVKFKGFIGGLISELDVSTSLLAGCAAESRRPGKGEC